MTNDVAVEPATLDDAPAIAAIYAHYVASSTATFEIQAPDEEEIARRMRTVLEGGCPWLVARGPDGAVLGFAYAARFHPREGFRYSVETSIYIHHERTRRGVGTALINALIGTCERRGYRQAFAVIAGTEPASIVLHARAGYRPCGTLESAGRKKGQWIDVFYMQRSLGEGSETAPAAEP